MTLPSPTPIDRFTSKRSQMPVGTKLLFVTTLARRVGWLEAALTTEVGTRLEVSEALGGPDGLARLRDEVFDAVLMQHEPPTLDALKLVAGLRAGGFGDPVVVVGDGDWAEECHVAGANGYCDLSRATSRSLSWVCRQALERHALEQENKRLRQQEMQRRRREQEAAERLLQQQQQLVHTLRSLDEAGGTLSPDSPWSSAVENRYRELLRAYVMMGSGNLAEERQRLVAVLVAEGLTVPQLFVLHVGVLTRLMRELGSRASRCLMNRADMLALEVAAHLAEEQRLRFCNAGLTG